MSDEPRSACPWSPSSEEGRSWLYGWANAEAIRREATGQMRADTDRMKAEANASAVAWDHAYQPDPTAAILGLRHPTAEAFESGMADIGRVLRSVASKFAEMAEVVNRTIIPPDVLGPVGIIDARPAPNRNQRRHGRMAACPRHGETTGGLCRPCARDR